MTLPASAPAIDTTRAIAIGVLESKIDRGLMTIAEALGRAYDAGRAAATHPSAGEDEIPTVRARTLPQLLSAAAKAHKR